MIPMYSRFLFPAFIPLLVWACLEFPVEAQDSSDQRPTPPYLAPMPERVHWVVTFTYVPKNDSGTPPASTPSDHPASIETTKVGTMRRVVLKFADGSAKQFDFVGNHYFVQGPLGLEYRTLGGELPPYKFFSLRFLFTECVNLASFKNYTTYQNVPVFHYRDDSTEAWIAVDSKLPVGADSIDSVKATYQFLPTPGSDAIVLTPEEQRLLQNQKKAEQLYNSMR
jgi:hypothetical protein